MFLKIPVFIYFLLHMFSCQCLNKMLIFKLAEFIECLSVTIFIISKGKSVLSKQTFDTKLTVIFYVNVVTIKELKTMD